MIPHPLNDILLSPLPSKSSQRKLRYRPTHDEVHETYELLNAHIFNSQLIKPSINMRSLNVWGLCLGYTEPTHYAKIRLSNKFFCKQWMVMILAHEMAHQFQWEIHGPQRILQKREPLLSHGATFFEMKHKLVEIGIPLKTTYCSKKWLKHQDLMRV